MIRQKWACTKGAAPLTHAQARYTDTQVQLQSRGRCGYGDLQATMAYTTEDVMGLLDVDGSYIDSSDDDLGFEIDENDYAHIHTETAHPQGKYINNFMEYIAWCST